MFKYAAKVGVADVIFGEPGDAQLLGALTLEALGLVLDPLRRELKLLPMVLGWWPPDKERAHFRPSPTTVVSSDLAESR